MFIRKKVKEQTNVIELPGTEALEKELNRVKYNRKYVSIVKSTVYTLITVAAIAVLVATLWLPVLQIYGTSMTPKLHEGDIVVSVKGNNAGQGDVIAFYYNNKILVKRVIAFPGDWVDIDENGQVYINQMPLGEPYLQKKAYGDTDIELPYQVPDGKIFVMGDHRETSLDSRNSAIGCVSEEQIVGKIVYRIWPLNRFARI